MPPNAPPNAPHDGFQADRDERASVFTGVVERVTFHSEDTGYTVLRVVPEGSCDPQAVSKTGRCTAVGRMQGPGEGLRVRLGGAWQSHANHGLQFAFDTVQVLPPASAEGIARYLSSPSFPGIGATLAQRIVEHLGEETLTTIRDNPDALRGIKGLREPVAQGLVEAVRAQHGAHRSLAYLQGLGLGPVQAAAVLASLGPECESLVADDPYILARGVRGLGFATADRIARAAGVGVDDPRRRRAGLMHALKSSANDGHTLLTREALFKAAQVLLDGSHAPEELGAALDLLASRGELIVEPPPGCTPAAPSPGSHEDLIYLPWLAASERGLARNLLRLLGSAPVPPLANARDLARAELQSGLELHEDQRSAVLTLLAEPVGLLTGGPGVGKTTIVRLLVQLAEAAGVSVLLSSPTGRAAKRLAEATGRQGQTLHRMLGYRPRQDDGDDLFAFGEDQPLSAGLVIVDEISMLDVVLAHSLLKAVQPPTRLILVGDPDQLPSVGAGNVLSDLIACGLLPCARLSRIYRQGQGSGIVSAAHRILAGEVPHNPAPGVRDGGYYFFKEEDPARTEDLLLDVVTQRIPRTFGFDWRSKVQVISPMYRGECGVDALNERLRAAQGTGGREVTRAGRTWRTGDRVIQTRNDYEREVFNGDMGRIIEIQAEGDVRVRFPEREVAYSGAALGDLLPAFAITVHRAQGSEFPVVVIPLVTRHFMMLQRHLLYTALTRARSLVVLVGSTRALGMALQNTDQEHRESRLAERLRAEGLS
ncbi:MAG: ATP-dependent RecD-like DNA helicase [Planctomycetes bacterium]|nr:ATP-dependent RecD-like DNA helicase [Planctomycetota bacterium]HJO25827.1 ATP-dependent RecD-like DNA helicase [Planctomycetota bacterium]